MRRFWKIARIVPVESGFAVRLDERPVKTPMRAELILPNANMASAVLAEWDAVGEKIDPAIMPITGLANAAIDRIAADRAGFVDAIAAYGETDLFCYRADEPDELASRQASIWGRYLRWAQARYFVTFTVVTGIMHATSAHPDSDPPERSGGCIEQLAIGRSVQNGSDYRFAGCLTGAGRGRSNRIKSVAGFGARRIVARGKMGRG